MKNAMEYFKAAMMPGTISRSVQSNINRLTNRFNTNELPKFLNPIKISSILGFFPLLNSRKYVMNPRRNGPVIKNETTPPTIGIKEIRARMTVYTSVANTGLPHLPLS
jgi:hypothetical protein